MLTREQVLRPLARMRGDAIVVTTMGTVRPWARVSQSPLDYASADSAMGHAADLALGIALAQPQRKVICLNGDGSMLMTLGSLVTIVAARARNLILFVMQNDAYEITGNQPTPAAGRLDFAAMARGAGFARVYTFDDRDLYKANLEQILKDDGPLFVCLKVEQGSEKPLCRGPQVEEHYLRVSLAESTHRLRRILTQT